MLYIVSRFIELHGNSYTANAGFHHEDNLLVKLPSNYDNNRPPLLCLVELVRPFYYHNIYVVFVSFSTLSIKSPSENNPRVLLSTLR